MPGHRRFHDPRRALRLTRRPPLHLSRRRQQLPPRAPPPTPPDPAKAPEGADAIYTDVCTSMGQEHEAAKRAPIFKPFQVNEDLMSRAQPSAVFMHCLPAHRGAEVTDAVLDRPQSSVFDQAENRMHAQKAITLMLLGGAKRIPSVRNKGGLQPRTKR